MNTSKDLIDEIYTRYGGISLLPRDKRIDFRPVTGMPGKYFQPGIDWSGYFELLYSDSLPNGMRLVWVKKAGGTGYGGGGQSVHAPVMQMIGILDPKHESLIVKVAIEPGNRYQKAGAMFQDLYHVLYEWMK